MKVNNNTSIANNNMIVDFTFAFVNDNNDVIFTGTQVLWIISVIIISVLLGQIIDWVAILVAIAGIVYVVMKFNKQAAELKSSINFRYFE